MPKVIYHDSEGVDRTIALGSEPVLIGRATECHIQTQDAMVSRRHARIIWDGNYWIEDLGSSNGVYVGTEKVQRAPFRIGDTITCGSLVLKMVPDTAPRASQPGLTGSPGAGSPGTPPLGAPSLPSAMPPPAMGRTTAPQASAAPPPAHVPSYGAPPAYPGPSSPQRTAAFDAAGNIIPNPPPPTAPPPVAAPPPAAPPPVAPPVAAPPSAPSGVSAAELESERRRRMQAEEALLAAEERARIAETRAKEAEAASKEALVLKRRVDQLTADLKRLRGGQPVDGGGADDGRLAAAEAERDQLRARVAELERSRGGAGGGISTQAADTLVLLSDALAELRASMRAANDEAALLTAPHESVDVIRDALRTAAEQLETARDRLRSLGKLLGVS
jgi:hypothetical protein